MPGVSLNSKGETNFKLKKSKYSGTIKTTFFFFFYLILLISATITNIFFFFTSKER